jgi:hypothetical protein
MICTSLYMYVAHDIYLTRQYCFCADDDHESEGDNSENIRSLLETFQKRFIEEMAKDN